MEREVIRLALEQTNGRVSHAERLAGMSWQGLSYALRTRHQRLAPQAMFGYAKLANIPVENLLHDYRDHRIRQQLGLLQYCVNCLLLLVWRITILTQCPFNQDH